MKIRARLILRRIRIIGINEYSGADGDYLNNSCTLVSMADGNKSINEFSCTLDSWADGNIP
jgi:hypothetical protein